MTTTDTRHCWIPAWRQGQQVMKCDRCEMAIRARSERALPEHGCKGSLYEQMNRT